jgi:hypothetical protein
MIRNHDHNAVIAVEDGQSFNVGIVAQHVLKKLRARVW